MIGFIGFVLVSYGILGGGFAPFSIGLILIVIDG
jgi:hypothetical protein